MMRIDLSSTRPLAESLASMKFLVPILLAALAACAPNASSIGNSNGQLAAGAPQSDIEATASLYREAVLRSERLGTAIYRNDYATAFATEMLLDSGALAGDRRIAGWVTQDSEGSLLVTYVAEENGRRLVGYEVAFADGPTSPPILAPTPADAPLTGERAVMYNARNTALAEAMPPCATNYNTVVLPASLIGSQGWLVYLLVASLNPGERVLAGHDMVRVSPDGLISLGSPPLSLSCRVEQVVPPAGTEPSGLFVVHLATAWPLETHVYTSLVYGVPLTVQTSAGTWVVDGDKIELVNLTAAR